MSLSGQLYCRPTFLSTNLILFVFQKLFSAPKLHLITTIWKYLVKTLSATITHLTHPTSNPSYPFKVNYWFMKSLSQNFEVLTQRANVINPKLTRERAQTRISCTNGVRKMKIKSKRNFDVRYSCIKLFCRNLENLVPCRDVIISKLGHKDSNCISC